MPLDARGFQLTPDIIGAARGGLQLGEQFRQVGAQREAREREEQIRQLLGGQVVPQTQQEAMLGTQTAEFADVSPQAAIEQPQILSQDELIKQAQQIDPVMANQQLKALGLDEPSRRAEASRFAAEVQSLPIDMQNQRIQQRAQTLQSQGRDPKDTLELLQMTPVERAQALQGVQLLDLSTKERIAAKVNLASIKKDLAGTKEIFDRASKLRGEITKVSTDFNKQEGAWTRVKASAENPSPAGDLALIFNFMKVLDPGSTVREGEFAQVGAAGNLPTQIQRTFDQWATGQKLTAGQRGDVVDRAKKLFSAAEKNNKRDVAKIVSIGKQFNVPKENLLGAEKASPIDVGTASIEELQAEAARLRGQ